MSRISYVEEVLNGIYLKSQVLYPKDILKIKPSVTGALDSYVWLAAKSGSYSAKSGFFVAAAMNHRENRASEKRKPSSLQINLVQ